MKKELLQKAKAAKSAEELHALAKAEGMEMTMEEAAEAFHKLNPPLGKLTDEELENISGGGCGSEPALDFRPNDTVTVIKPLVGLLICTVEGRTRKPYESASESVVPDCRSSTFNVRMHEAYERNYPYGPNDPRALYLVSCTHCTRRFSVLKEYLYHG